MSTKSNLVLYADQGQDMNGKHLLLDSDTLLHKEQSLVFKKRDLKL